MVGARVAVPASLGAFLVWVLVSGQVYFFVHERTVWLIALSVPVLVAIGLAWLGQRATPTASRLALASLAVPVVLGFAVPARPLGSVALASQDAGRPTAPRRASVPIDLRPAGVTLGATGLTWTLR